MKGLEKQMKKKIKVVKADALDKEVVKRSNERVKRFCDVVGTLAMNMDLSIREIYLGLKILEKTCEIQDEKVIEEFNRTFGKEINSASKIMKSNMNALDKDTKVKKATGYIG